MKDTSGFDEQLVANDPVRVGQPLVLRGRQLDLVDPGQEVRRQDFRRIVVGSQLDSLLLGEILELRRHDAATFQVNLKKRH